MELAKKLYTLLTIILIIKVFYLSNPPITNDFSVTRNRKSIMLHMKCSSMFNGMKNQLSNSLQRAHYYKQLFNECIMALKILDKQFPDDNFSVKTWLISKKLKRQLEKDGFIFKECKMDPLNKISIEFVLSRQYGSQKAEQIFKEHRTYKILWTRREAELLIQKVDKCLS